MIQSFEYIKEVIQRHSKTFFPQTRGGNTAVGHTLETSLFHKTEDNKAKADIGDAELKASTGKGSKRVRLATYNCGAEKSLLLEYGQMNKANTKRQFYPLFTMGKEKKFGNLSAGLQMDYDRLQVCFNDRPVGYWEIDIISGMITNKLRNIAVVEAEKKIVGGVAHFRYNAVNFFSGLCIPSVISGIENGLIKVEFRINDEHDHGTSFNTTTKAMKDLYQYSTRITF